MNEIMYFLGEKIRFVPALDLIKCLKQINRDCSLSAPYFCLPSNIVTRVTIDYMGTPKSVLHSRDHYKTVSLTFRCIIRKIYEDVLRGNVLLCALKIDIKYRVKICLLLF